jgi:hypothetical protein
MPDLPDITPQTAESPTVTERRMVLRVLDHWRKLGSEDAMPTAAAVDPMKIPDWPCCFLLDVGNHPDDPVFTDVGRMVVDDCGCDIRGLALSQVPRDTLADRATQYWRRVIAKRVPISMGGDFIHQRNCHVLFRSILLPLQGDDERLVALLGAVNCRDVALGSGC